MKTEKRKIGDIGEKIAVRWLENKGFNILDRNYLKKWGEIDIVAQKGSALRFIEVKSVSRDLSTQAGNLEKIGQGNDEYRPEENVHPKKLERLFRTIETYLFEKNYNENQDWQLDVAVVYLDFNKKTAKVSHLENIIG